MGISLRLQRFCCCCTLRTGTVVIGTLGWLITLSKIFFIPATTHPDNIVYIPRGRNSRFDSFDYSTIPRIGACVISLIVSVLLIVGVYKKNNKFMLPWLVFQCIECIVVSIGCLIWYDAIFCVDSDLTISFIVCTVVLLVMGSLSWYFWICVWSHYMELNENKAVISPNIRDSPTHVSPPPNSQAGAPLV